MRATDGRNGTRPPANGLVPTARVLILLVLLAATGGAWGHATIVFGTVATDPAPPPADAPFDLLLEMRDPTDAPVEDALVFVQATHEAGGTSVAEAELEEVTPGAYRTVLRLGEPGTWTLTFRDRTFRQEEARTTVALGVGPDAETEPVSFIFPPTATGPRNLSTWLAWLVGLPLAAGALVTILVLRGGPRET